jgi:hypothetical protein
MPNLDDATFFFYNKIRLPTGSSSFFFSFPFVSAHMLTFEWMNGWINEWKCMYVCMYIYISLFPWKFHILWVIINMWENKTLAIISYFYGKFHIISSHEQHVTKKKKASLHFLPYLDGSFTREEDPTCILPKLVNTNSNPGNWSMHHGTSLC